MKRFKLLSLLVISIFLSSFHKPESRKGLNSEQVLILRKAANDLNFKIQNFKAQSSKKFNTPVKQELYNSLRDSLFQSTKEVKKIQSAFIAASSNGCLCSFARNYFNDILYRYDECQDSLISYNQKFDYGDKSYAKVLSVYEYNYKAYSVVAEEKEPHFDLAITTTPYGATIYYWKEGDKPEAFHKTTLATIKNLDYCTWHFSIHLDGYIDVQKDFDPYNEKEKVLDFGQLKAK